MKPGTVQPLSNSGLDIVKIQNTAGDENAGFVGEGRAEDQIELVLHQSLIPVLWRQDWDDHDHMVALSGEGLHETHDWAFDGMVFRAEQLQAYPWMPVGPFLLQLFCFVG